MEEEMETLYTEGVATHGGPESCVGDPRGRSEALTGVHVGRAIEPRNQLDRGAHAVERAEGNIAGGVIASRQRTPRGRRTCACVEPPCARTGRSRDHPTGGWPGGTSRQRPGGNPGMNDHGKSDLPVVPAKPPNNAGLPAAEAVEERGRTKGNTASKTRPGHSAGSGAPNALDRVRQVARRDKEARFTALLHHVDADRLRAAYRAISPKAAAGVDGETWAAYGQDLETVSYTHLRAHETDSYLVCRLLLEKKKKSRRKKLKR